MIALNNTLIIKKHTDKHRDSTIIIPDVKGFNKSYSHTEYCEVISVGPKFPYAVKPGDNIICEHNEGKKFIYKNNDYFIMAQKWVHAIIPEGCNAVAVMPT